MLRLAVKEKSPLALRADAEKFQFVGDGFKTILLGNLLLDFRRKTFLKLNHFGALRADEMMVMAVASLLHQFKPRRAIMKMKPLHDAGFFQQVHRAINRSEVTDRKSVV